MKSDPKYPYSFLLAQLKPAFEALEEQRLEDKPSISMFDLTHVLALLVGKLKEDVLQDYLLTQGLGLINKSGVKLTIKNYDSLKISPKKAIFYLEAEFKARYLDVIAELEDLSIEFDQANGVNTIIGLFKLVKD